MRPFDDTPMEDEDYGDVALQIAAVREWPREEFTRELDARVQQRFAAPPARAASGRRMFPARLPRWAAGPAVAVVAGGVAAVVVLTGGAPGQLNLTGRQKLPVLAQHAAQNGLATFAPKSEPSPTPRASASVNAPGAAGGTAATSKTAANPAVSALAPVTLAGRQIQSAQISLTASNQRVSQVASEVMGVVSAEHGSVRDSHITQAASNAGGSYATLSLSIPTPNLQDAMTQLSRLRYASVSSRTDASQNVSNQYNNDRRQLADARALRSSLLKQLQSAYTQAAIDSIKAQLKLAEQQITSWENTLSSLQHRIGYSTVEVQINASFPVPVPIDHSSTFTLARAGHDALRVLVVSAGVALIGLAAAVPAGLVAALLVWLWVWLRQRRREHALDTSE